MSSVSLWRRLHLCLDISVDARIDRVEKKITSMLQRYDRIAIMPRADGVVGVLERELSNLARRLGDICKRLTIANLDNVSEQRKIMTEFEGVGEILENIKSEIVIPMRNGLPVGVKLVGSLEELDRYFKTVICERYHA